MTRDKQLLGVELGQVIEKRRLDQALNAKEFAVLAGVSYSTARSWFRQPGFPCLSGVVFWGDFVRWRNARMGSGATSGRTQQATAIAPANAARAEAMFTGKAAQLLAEAS
jgi:hypothetical protein